MFLLNKSKWLVVGGITLFLVSSSIATILYIRSAERGKIITEVQDRQIENRTKVDRAVRESYKSGVDGAIEYLKGRQQ